MPRADDEPRQNDDQNNGQQNRQEEYRRYAAQCLALAQNTENPIDRSRLLEMAQAFNELAAKTAAGDDPTRK